MKPLQFINSPPATAAFSQPPSVLRDVYQEHGEDPQRMVETLLFMEVETGDVDLLSRMPWPYLANRIAVERERLGLSPVHPFLHWKLPPPPPAWLTPAVMQKMFQLALDDLDDDLPTDDLDDDCAANSLVLPA